MDNVEVTLELTKRAAMKFVVSQLEYQMLYDGTLPDRIRDEIIDVIKNHPETCDEDIDWAAVDCDTGKTINDWR